MNEETAVDVSSETSEALIFDKLKWMTSKEAAFYLRVSVGQLRNMVWRCQVKCYRIRNRLRFLRSDLDSLLLGTAGSLAPYQRS